MPEYRLEHLNRDAYISSIAEIQDPKTARFANMSLLWWDKYLIWYQQGCVVLVDEENRHLSYIFYKIDRYNEYINIHNLFTPLEDQRKGHAYTLLKMVFSFASAKNVRRFKLSSISNSLDFYLSLGFVYWGLNSVGDYYCDLPMPKEGLDTLSKMISAADMPSLIGKRFDTIYTKISQNHTKLTAAQTLTYDADKLKMGKNYRLESMLTMKDASR